MKITGGWLTVNRACNMRCPWCYASATKYEKNATMPPTLAKRLIGIFKGLGVKNIIILGGEPTIYPHLNEVLQYTISQGIRPVIVTNGKKLADYSYARSLKEIGLLELTLSLKAVEAEEYKLLSHTGDVGLFSSIRSAVKNVQELGLGLNLSVTLVQSFFGKFRELVDLLVQLNPAHVTIDMGSPIVTPQGMDATGILNPRQLSEALTVLHDLLKKTGLNYSFYVSIPLCILDERVKNEIIREGKILTTCHVPKGKGLIFTPEGEVVLCNHFSSFPLGRFGADFSTPEEFMEFWEREDISLLRSRATMYPDERCRNCHEWDICGGGCFVKWLHWDPKAFMPTNR